jgi:hypothetical protein
MKKFLWEGVPRIVWYSEDLNKPIISAINGAETEAEHVHCHLLLTFLN